MPLYPILVETEYRALSAVGPGEGDDRMRLALPRQILGASVAGLALLAGCNQCTRLYPSCSQRPFDACIPIVPAPLPIQNATVPSNQPITLPPRDGRPTTLPSALPTAKRDQTPEPPELPALAVNSGNHESSTSQAKRQAADLAVAVQPAGYVTAAPAAPPALRPRSQGDLSADPCFDHADDYTWLTGRLEYLYVRSVWRIRYAGCDEDDRFGGSLVLTASFPVKEFKDGQLIHVEGQVLDAETHDQDRRPLYEVHAVQILNNP
jgi:hypothetical protein